VGWLRLHVAKGEPDALTEKAGVASRWVSLFGIVVTIWRSYLVRLPQPDLTAAACDASHGSIAPPADRCDSHPSNGAVFTTPQNGHGPLFGPAYRENLRTGTAQQGSSHDPNPSNRP